MTTEYDCTQAAALLSEIERLREENERIAEAVKFIDTYFKPWGSWKTAWWEGEVSHEPAFCDGNALKHVANILRRPARRLTEGQG
jgi:hypothetical protein